MITVEEVVAELTSRRDERLSPAWPATASDIDHAYGLSVPEVRALGKRIVKELGRRDPARHAFALELWETGIHEARLLAGMVDLPEMVTEEQMEAWVLGLDSWDVCDQLCNNLFVYCPLAWDKALEWSGRQEEFVKRAGFALMASLAWHGKDAPDERFLPLLAAIEREAGDERNYVKKAVNWALRNIGKRSPALHAQAVETARRIAASESKAGRWVGCRCSARAGGRGCAAQAWAVRQRCCAEAAGRRARVRHGRRSAKIQPLLYRPQSPLRIASSVQWKRDPGEGPCSRSRRGCSGRASIRSRTKSTSAYWPGRCSRRGWGPRWSNLAGMR